MGTLYNLGVVLNRFKNYKEKKTNNNPKVY